MTTYRCELWVGTTWVDSVDVEADSQATAAERCAEQMRDGTEQLLVPPTGDGGREPRDDPRERDVPDR